MDRITLTITSDLFDDDDVDQQASVRANLSVRGLVEEIRREFNLLDGDYSLSIKGSKKALDADKTMDQLNLKTGAELVFTRQRNRLSQQIVARGGQFFQAITGRAQAMLREEGSAKVFPLEWQPAIIGRPDANNTSSAEMLAVNLGDLPEARTVSRQHARISEYGGQFYLEGLAQRNPTFLNDRELLPGEKRAVMPGDEIRVGKIMLTFDLQQRG